MDIWQAAVDRIDRNQDFVLATILAVKGSSPRHVGTRFLVASDGTTVGTIGGGLFEAQVQEIALEALKARVSRHVDFSFTGADDKSTQMICGGNAEVLVEFVDSADEVNRMIYRSVADATRGRRTALFYTPLSIPLGQDKPGPLEHILVTEEGAIVGGFPGDATAISVTPEKRFLKPAQAMCVTGVDCPVFLEWLRPSATVHIFGGGHVGVCVAHLASYCHFRVMVIDDRPEFITPDRFPDADERMAVESFSEAFSRIPMDSDSFVVIVTRGHSHDKTCLGEALKTSAGYIGMIGSKRKNAIILQALLMEGFTRDDLARVHAPIGIPIGGETPEEIGVSIVGQMIQVRDRSDRLRKLGGDSGGRGPCASGA